MVNIAERVHRIRRRRDYQRADTGTPQPESLHDALLRLKRQDVSPDELRDWLERIDIEPVFTAHPTEARRRAVSTSIRRLVALLTEYDASLRGGADQRRAERRMLEEIDTLWRTAPLRAEKPTPVDEVRAIMSVFDETLYTAIPHVYRRVDDALQGPAAGSRAPVIRPFVRLGTWVGGDRDGNRIGGRHEDAGRERHDDAGDDVGGAAGGEDGVDELTELEEKIKKTRMSKEARTKALGELKKLRQMSPMAAEATVVRNWLDVLLALPWLMYQCWMFVAPGLYSHEKKFALPLIFFGSLLAGDAWGILVRKLETNVDLLLGPERTALLVPVVLIAVIWVLARPDGPADARVDALADWAAAQLQ